MNTDNAQEESEGIHESVRVAGKPLNNNSGGLDEFLHALEKIDTGLTDKVDAIDVGELVPQDWDDNYQQARNAEKQWLDDRTNVPLLTTLQNAVAKCIDESEDDSFEKAHLFQWYSEICNTAGFANLIEEAGMHLAERAANIYRDLDRFDGESVALGTLHTAITTLIDAKKKEGDLNGVEELSGKLPDVAARSTKALVREHYDVPIEETAFRVEQGEVGYSKEELIGTDNLQDCICLMLHNPITHMTAVAHIDWTIAPDSLEQMLENMGTPPLQARLVGGIDSGEETDNKKNIEKVHNFLKNKNIDILSSWVHRDEQPEGVVVDPKTFKLREAFPWKHDLNSSLGQALNVLVEKPRPLHEAFNLATGNKTRNPIILNPQLIDFDLTTIGKTHIEIHDWYKENMPDISEKELPAKVGKTFKLMESYRASLEHIYTCLDERVDSLINSPQLKAQGIHIKQEEIQEKIRATKELLAKHPIAIGDGANQANENLINFIKTPKQFISVNPTADGGHTVDFNFAFPTPSTQKSMKTSRKRARSTAPEPAENVGASSSAASARSHETILTSWSQKERDAIKNKIMEVYGGTDLGKNFTFNLSDAPQDIEQIKKTLNGRMVVAEFANGDVLIAAGKTLSKNKRFDIMVLSKDTIEKLRKSEGVVIDAGKNARFGSKKRTLG